MTPVTQRILKQIQGLLKGATPELIEQGAQLAVSLADAAVSQALLSSCVLDLHGNLLLNDTFTDLSQKTRWGPEPDPVRQGALTLAVLEIAGRGPVVPEIPRSLTRLRIDRLSFPELPQVIGCFADLEVLVLPYNNIQRLPESLGGLTALRELELNGNPLTGLPASLLRPGLEQLNLGWCRLGHLPDELGAISTLRELVISENNLSALPDLSGLRALTGLSLWRNALTGIPAGIQTLSELVWLDLRANPLRSLAGLEHLTGLKTLWLDDEQRHLWPEVDARLPGVRLLRDSGKPPADVRSGSFTVEMPPPPR